MIALFASGSGSTVAATDNEQTLPAPVAPEEPVADDGVADATPEVEPDVEPEPPAAPVETSSGTADAYTPPPPTPSTPKVRGASVSGGSSSGSSSDWMTGSSSGSSSGSGSSGADSYEPYVAPEPPPPEPEPVAVVDDLPDIEPPPFEGTGEPEVDMGMEYSGDLNALAGKAQGGKLGDADKQYLEGWDSNDDDFTRAYVLLYENAKAKGDDRSRDRYMRQLMAVPENRYNPTLLVEEAEIQIRKRNYNKALEKANLAERHWARLPSSLIFSRKMMIYEIQASSWQGKYYESGGEDMDALDKAIRGWDKYKRHVETKNRADLAVKADTQLTRLYDMKKRVGG